MGINMDRRSKTMLAQFQNFARLSDKGVLTKAGTYITSWDPNDDGCDDGQAREEIDDRWWFVPKGYLTEFMASKLLGFKQTASLKNRRVNGNGPPYKLYKHDNTTYAIYNPADRTAWHDALSTTPGVRGIRLRG